MPSLNTDNVQFPVLGPEDTKWIKYNLFPKYVESNSDMQQNGYVNTPGAAMTS